VPPLLRIRLLQRAASPPTGFLKLWRECPQHISSPPTPSRLLASQIHGGYILDCVRDQLRRGGVRSLFRGFPLHFGCECVGNGAYLTTYAYAKQVRAQGLGGRVAQPGPAAFILGRALNEIAVEGGLEHTPRVLPREIGRALLPRPIPLSRLQGPLCSTSPRRQADRPFHLPCPATPHRADS
jgi:hypothetical protein